MPDLDIDANCTRADFGYSVPMQTRWKDIDPYCHVNNTNYFTFFDTAIMHFLTVAGGFDLLDGPVVPFTVENMCRYHGSIEFPMVIDCALRVAHLGNSSVALRTRTVRSGLAGPARHRLFHRRLRRQRKSESGADPRRPACPPGGHSAGRHPLTLTGRQCATQPAVLYRGRDRGRAAAAMRPAHLAVALNGGCSRPTRAMTLSPSAPPRSLYNPAALRPRAPYVSGS